MTSSGDSSFGRFHRTEINPTRESVALAYCHGDVIRPEFAKAVINTVAAGRGRHIHAFITSSGLYVPEGRNQIVRQFLGVGDCEWLWFLDTDVAFPPDALERLLKATNEGERKIVAAAYWSESTEGQPYCTWMYLNEDGFHPYLRVPETGMTELASSGMGCTLIHRDVFVDIAKDHDSDDPWTWFGHDLMETNEGLIRAGEDISFCVRAARAGHTTWGFCDLPVDHYKIHATRRGPAPTRRVEHRMAPINGGPPINTAISDVESDCLSHLAEDGRVLEIGAGHGYSTIVLARAAASVVSVDPHGGEMLDSWKILNDNLDKHGVRDRVTLYRKRSSETLPELHSAGERFSLVFVDGDHTRDGVRHDVSWAIKLLEPGGYVVCHDYDNEDCPGVRLALEGIPHDIVGTLWVHQVDESLDSEEEPYEPSKTTQAH